MRRLVLPFMCLALLGACETTSGAPPVGPSEVRIEADRYRVIFRGVSGASGAEVQDRALLHAANLALRDGYDWLRVVSRGADIAPATSPQITFGIGGMSFGRHSGFGLGASQTVGGQPTYVASLEVLFGRGRRPDGDPNVYDARDLVASLGPRLAPPPPR